jgi:TRAP-type uncharacterized transport system substrate-binding protein
MSETPPPPPPPRRFGRLRLPSRLSFVSWRDVAVTLGPVFLLSVAAIWAAFWFVRPAPPDTIVITTGPEGSSFHTHAERYRKILARNGVKLEILPSHGSLENLKRLADPAFTVDVGFVQGGIADGVQIEGLVSLGSMFNQPLAVFYSGPRIYRLSQLKGKRVAIGAEGSGAHVLALTLLKANGIEPGGATVLQDLTGDAAIKALTDGTTDAAFLMGDSAAGPAMRKLMDAPGIRLFDFPQAEGYTRRFRYLNKLELPMGSIDLGRNVPARNLHLVGPTVELIARENLHPALSDLLIEAATEVHGKATTLQKAGEFPAPVERDFPISGNATRYYKSGKSLVYRHLPFWIASLVDRTAVLILPILVILLPGLRLAPVLYRWRVGSRIYRWYGALLALERDVRAHSGPEGREELLKRLADIENGVGRIKVPLSFAGELYVLREHVNFVRGRLQSAKD